jgi:hypothetical protein
LTDLGGNENRQSSGTRNRQRPIDPKTIEGLGNLSEEDKKAALEAMGNPELTQQVNQSQASQRTEDYEPPDQPYEPIGDGMYQFHRRQPLQLPIHGGGTDSRPQNICMMPLIVDILTYYSILRNNGIHVHVYTYIAHGQQ